MATLIACTLILPLYAQESNGHINFESGIFTGETSAYSKSTFTFLFENIYAELVKPVGDDSGICGCGYTIGSTIGGLRLRPWLDENMFSIGWGFETEYISSKKTIGLTDAGLEAVQEPTEWKKTKTRLASSKFILPLTYARDLKNNLRLSLTAIPSISSPGYTEEYETVDKWRTNTWRDGYYFDIAFSAGISINEYGFYIKYKPNLMWREAYNTDLQAISFGLILTH